MRREPRRRLQHRRRPRDGAVRRGAHQVASSLATRLYANGDLVRFGGRCTHREGGRDMRLVTTLGVVLTFGIAVTGLPAESGAAQATLGCPATAQAGQQFTIEITVDVGTTPLGAYSSVLMDAAAVLTLASVAGGNTAEFSGKPTTNTPMPGTTNLSAFQSVSLTSPTGVVSVAMITFNVAATASTTTAIGLTVKNLFDTNSAPILPATGTGCSVSVTGAGSTTTSTTSTTIATSTTSTTTTSSTTTSPTTTTQRPTTTTTSTTTSTTATTITPPPTTSTTTTTTHPTTTTSSSTATSSTTSSTTTSTTARTTTSTSSTTTTSISITTTTAPPTGQCPEGLGFWKTHPELWTVSSLTLGSQAYAQAELLTLLTSPVRGDASVLLARKLIPAKLNIANGSDPTPIAETIADADGLLSGFARKLPCAVAPSSVTGRAMFHAARLLATYNDGELTPTCSTTAAGGPLQPAVERVAGQLDAISAACSGERMPRGLQRRLERAERLLARAGAHGGQGSEVLLGRAARQLRGGAAVASRAARSSRVSAECSGMLRSALADASEGGEN